MALIQRNDNDNVIDGTDFADTIYAYGGDDDVYGYGGDDTIYGGTGDDIIYGGSGHDDIYGASGNNNLYGGTGQDWFIMSARSTAASDDLILDFQFDADRIDLRAWGVSDFSQVKVMLENTGNDSALLSAWYDGYDHYIEIDGAIAQDFLARDFIYANPSAGTFNGTGYDDVLFGSRGHDTVYGNGGTDILLGGAGDDDLYGDAGDDELWGGAGSDYMYGGSGSDLFGFLTASEINGPSGRDLILDFEPDIDVIDFSRIDADTTIQGNQKFEWIGTGRFTEPGQLRYAISGDTTVIIGNTDFDKDPEFRLALDDAFHLISTDFIL